MRKEPFWDILLAIVCFAMVGSYLFIPNDVGITLHMRGFHGIFDKWVVSFFCVTAAIVFFIKAREDPKR